MEISLASNHCLLSYPLASTLASSCGIRPLLTGKLKQAAFRIISLLTWLLAPSPGYFSGLQPLSTILSCWIKPLLTGRLQQAASRIISLLTWLLAPSPGDFSSLHPLSTILSCGIKPLLTGAATSCLQDNKLAYLTTGSIPMEISLASIPYPLSYPLASSPCLLSYHVGLYHS